MHRKFTWHTKCACISSGRAAAAAAKSWRVGGGGGKGYVPDEKSRMHRAMHISCATSRWNENPSLSLSTRCHLEDSGQVARKKGGEEEGSFASIISKRGGGGGGKLAEPLFRDFSEILKLLGLNLRWYYRAGQNFSWISEFAREIKIRELYSYRTLVHFRNLY